MPSFLHHATSSAPLFSTSETTENQKSTPTNPRTGDIIMDPLKLMNLSLYPVLSFSTILSEVLPAREKNTNNTQKMILFPRLALVRKTWTLNLWEILNTSLIQMLPKLPSLLSLSQEFPLLHRPSIKWKTTMLLITPTFLNIKTTTTMEPSSIFLITTISWRLKLSQSKMLSLFLSMNMKIRANQVTNITNYL